MSCIPLLTEPACSSSELQGAIKMRDNDAAARLQVPLSDDNEREQSKSVQRKRVLPSWMLERELLEQSVSKPVMTGGSRKKNGQGRGEGHTESLKSEVNMQQKKRLASEDTVEDFEGGEQDQGKRTCLSIPIPSSQATEKVFSGEESKNTENCCSGQQPPEGAEAPAVLPAPGAGGLGSLDREGSSAVPAPSILVCSAGSGLQYPNTSGFPLENTMRDMEGNGKTGTKNPGSSLEKSDRQLHSKCSKRVGQISSKDSRLEETENKKQITGSTSQQAHWGRTCQYFGAQEGILEPDANLDYNTEISDSTRSADASESSKQIQRKRTPCMYGSGCYRKNPIHFQQFSHPHDEDYHAVERVAQDDHDSRPECPYGTDCYRKNPQHKLEYKHSAPPVSGRGARQRTSSTGKRAVKKDSANDGEANEYDLNDSFIDEEEEEECEPTDEDSDWEPSSEEKDNEDVETLVQEAQRFVRTKK